MYFPDVLLTISINSKFNKSTYLSFEQCYNLKSLIPGAQQNKIKPTIPNNKKSKKKTTKKYKQTKNKKNKTKNNNKTNLNVNMMCLYVLSSVLWCSVWFPHTHDVRLVFSSSFFIGRRMSCLCCLCVLVCGVQHILCCVFALFFFVVCTMCC